MDRHRFDHLVQEFSLLVERQVLVGPVEAPEGFDYHLKVELLGRLRHQLALRRAQ